MGTTSVRPVLPPGYRFAPTDEELMIFYLRNKVSFNPLPAGAITDIDADELYSKPPPAIVDNPRGETREWYFYIRNNKYEDDEDDEQKEGNVTTKLKKKRREEDEEKEGNVTTKKKEEEREEEEEERAVTSGIAAMELEEAKIGVVRQRAKWNGDLRDDQVKKYVEKKSVDKEAEEEKVGKKNVRMVGNGMGFWRSVGSDDLVYAGEMVRALKIHYIYFEGSITKCKKTHWRMEEYHLAAARGNIRGNIRGSGDDQQDFNKEEWVLGRITRGRGYCSD